MRHGGTVEGLIAAWRAAADAARAATTPDDALTAEIRLPSGTTSGAEFLRELFADHLIHTWDLARATGGDQRLPDDLVAACSDWFDANEDTWRAQGEIGPTVDVDVDDDAHAQTRLLAPLRPRPRGHVEPWEIPVALALCIVTIAVLVPTAARLYSGGALRFGGRIRIVVDRGGVRVGLPLDESDVVREVRGGRAEGRVRQVLQELREHLAGA